MVEKPAPSVAPSNYYINGRYILQPEVFELLGTQERGAGNEIQLTDAMLRLSQDQDFYAHPFEGRMFDCGSKEGFIQANVAFALARDDIRDLVFEPIAEQWLRRSSAAARLPDRGKSGNRLHRAGILPVQAMPVEAGEPDDDGNALSPDHRVRSSRAASWSDRIDAAETGNARSSARS